MTLFFAERLLYPMQTNRLRPKWGDGGQASDAGRAVPWAMGSSAMGSCQQGADTFSMGGISGFPGKRHQHYEY